MRRRFGGLASRFPVFVGALGLVTMSSLGCTTEEVSAPPTSLSEVTIPADFTFQTSETVAVEIAPPAEAFVSTPDAPVEVRRPDGAVLYRGAVRKDRPLKLEVSVPTTVRTLDVVVGQQHSTVDVGQKTRPAKD